MLMNLRAMYQAAYHCTENRYAKTFCIPVYQIRIGVRGHTKSGSMRHIPDTDGTHTRTQSPAFQGNAHRQRHCPCSDHAGYPKNHLRLKESLTMNIKKIAALLLLSASANVVLAGTDTTLNPPAGTSLTRAEVIQVRADGTLNIRDSEYPIIKMAGTPKTRAEVNAEVIQARADGTLDVRDSTYPVVQITGTPKTRAEVRAEVIEYKNNHPYGHADSLYRG
jgi:hypothetical protein